MTVTRTFLNAKLHRATVTQVDIDYVGSITVDEDLLDAVGIAPNEQVDVLDITNGARLTTYALAGERGSGIIGVNGAAAHLVSVGDLVIVCSYVQVSGTDVAAHRPVVAQLDESNAIWQLTRD